jgi:hypothetical protein
MSNADDLIPDDGTFMVEVPSVEPKDATKIADLVITDFTGREITNLNSIRHIDLIHACMREKKFEFILNRTLNASFKEIKISAKFYFGKNENDILQDYGRFQNKFGIKETTKPAKNLRLQISGDLELDCQVCCEKLSRNILLDEVYALVDSYDDSKDKDKTKSNFPDNTITLDDSDLMKLLCPNGRLDLVQISEHEVLLSLDMVPKHEGC